jgi:kynureninase
MDYGGRVARTALTTRADAGAFDAAEPLAGYRDRFALGDGRRIYVDGNSLGALAHDAQAAIEARVGEWRDLLVTGWHDWVDAPAAVGDRLAGAALGAGPGQVIVSDSTTVNLYKLACAALDVRPGAIVADPSDFPTDRYVLQGLAARTGRELRLLDTDPVAGPQPAEIEEACAGGAALVVLSAVNYRSGSFARMADITAAGHAAGALVLWDLCHAAGAVEVDLDAVGADLAVGCTYKYLNAGPGSPALLYVRSELQAELRSPIWGWFSQSDQFAMGPEYEPVEGIGRFLAGTPPIVALAAVDAGAAMLAEAGIGRVRAKAAALTSLAVDLHDQRLAPLGFTLGTPREPEHRGAHVSLRHPDAWRICRALIEQADVIPDFRAPDSIRFGLAPLYTRHVDVWDAVDRLAGIVESGEHERMDDARRRVT